MPAFNSRFERKMREFDQAVDSKRVFIEAADVNHIWMNNEKVQRELPVWDLPRINANWVRMACRQYICRLKPGEPERYYL